MNSFAKPETLVSTALAPLDWTRSVAVVVIFSLLTALAAQISIPLWPVPITGQTFAVTLTGALLGSRLGAMALTLYLIEGASGLPFFSGGGNGIQMLLGPTGGYLVSFPAAAFITGAFAEQGWDKRFLTAVAAMAIGSALILLAGWAWLTQFMTPAVAWHAGVSRFIIGDIVKVVLAAAVLPTGWHFLQGRASRRSQDQTKL